MNRFNDTIGPMRVKRNLIPALLVIFTARAAICAQAEVSSPIAGKLPGVEGMHSSELVSRLKGWTWPGVASDLPLTIHRLDTKGNPTYVGAEQLMMVNAPLEKVVTVLDDFGHYKDLFPGYDDIHVASRQGNDLVLFWEQHIPIFFIPNVKYQTAYRIDKTLTDRKIYRYQLLESSTLKESDGFIIVEREGSRTRYAEYDYFDSNWGPLSRKRVWRESLEGLYLSDVSLKLRAEHLDDPQWTYKRIEEEARKILDQHPIDALLEFKD